MKNAIGIILSILLMLLSGCEKDHATLLSAGIWSFEDMSTDSEESAVISIVSLTEALLTDAKLEFKEGGTYLINAPFLQEPIAGDWQLIGEDQLVLEPDGKTSSTSRIKMLTRDELVYSEEFVYGQAEEYTVTTTWKRN